MAEAISTKPPSPTSGVEGKVLTADTHPRKKVSQWRIISQTQFSFRSWYGNAGSRRCLSVPTRGWQSLELVDGNILIYKRLRRCRKSRIAEELCRGHLFLSYVSYRMHAFFGKGRDMGWKWLRHVPLSFSFFILFFTMGALDRFLRPPIPCGCPVSTCCRFGKDMGRRSGGRRKSDNMMV